MQRMNKSQNDNKTIEDQLAKFTDRILEKSTATNKEEIAQGPELRALEQAAQRLKNAFKDDGPSEAAIQRMRQNILSEWKQQERMARKPIWRRFVPKSSEQKWRSQRNRQRWSMATSVVVVAGAMLVTMILSNEGDFNQPAASGQNLNSGVLVVMGVLLLLVVWIFRRKL